MFATTARFVFVSAALLVGSPILAQEAPPAKDAGILDDRVDVLLREWSQRTGKIDSMYAEFTRTTIDKVFRSKEVAEGSARFLTPNKARLDIVNEESFVLNGKEIWHIRIPLKQIKVFKLPPDAAEANNIQDGPLPFLFGAQPDKAKVRYSFKILKEDEKVYHIEILPKLRDDQQNFSRAEIWLNKQTFLPDQLKFIEPNNNEMFFVFKGIWTNIKIEANDFNPQPIKDWQMVVQQLADGEQTDAPKLQR